MVCLYSSQIISELWSSRAPASHPVYAVLDGARDGRICDKIEHSNVDHCCLLSGRLHPELQKAAPYLVKLPYDHQLATLFINQGWDHHWGIFLEAATTLDALRFHLRQFLRVKDEQGRRLFFRFYDPRVLRVYLPTCTLGELLAFYGPITRFVMPGEDAAALMEFAFDGRELKVRSVPLKREAAATG